MSCLIDDDNEIVQERVKHGEEEGKGQNKGRGKSSVHWRVAE